MQARVTNASDVDIDVLLSPLTSPDPDRKFITTLSPGDTKAFHVNTGTMRLTIRDRRGAIIWRGPVPTFIKHPLVFSEDGVRYQDILLPSTSQCLPIWIWAVLGILLVLLILGGWYLLRKRN